MIKRCFLTAILLAVMLPAAWAQTQGRIEGRILDPAGNPLEKVAVSIVSTRASSVHYELITDKNGKFVQIGLSPGNFLVSAKKEGFVAVSQELRVGIDETKRFDIQLKTVEAVLEKSLSEADNLFLKGNKFYAEKKFSEAAAAYEEAIAKDPGSWRYYLNLGLSYKKLNKPEASLAAFKKAVELNPESPSANKEVGEALARSASLAEAKPYYEKAVRLSPDDADAHYNLGLCLSSTDEPEAALAEFRKAIELKPDSADAYYQLGTVLIGQNKIPEAVASLEKFLELAPDHEKAGLARQLIQALKK
jgi:tetratricopeptide (TPR) repeat protein